MKKYLYLLTIFLLFVACSASSENEHGLSKKQIEYAYTINEKANYKKENEDIYLINHAEWKDSLNLEVNTEFSIISKTLDPKTQKLMDDIAYAFAHDGYLITKKDICVTIVGSNNKKLAYKCVTKDDSQHHNL